MKTAVPSFIAAAIILAVSLCPAWRVGVSGRHGYDVVFRPLWYSFNSAPICPPWAPPPEPPDAVVLSRIAWDVMAVAYLCILLVWGMLMVGFRLLEKPRRL